MITRFRIEAEGDNQEEVEAELRAASSAMKSHCYMTHSNGWELTEERIAPAIDADGDAFISGRRVYRRVV